MRSAKISLPLRLSKKPNTGEFTLPVPLTVRRIASLLTKSSKGAFSLLIFSDSRSAVTPGPASFCANVSACSCPYPVAAARLMTAANHLPTIVSSFSSKASNPAPILLSNFTLPGTDTSTNGEFTAIREICASLIALLYTLHSEISPAKSYPLIPPPIKNGSSLLSMVTYGKNFCIYC